MLKFMRVYATSWFIKFILGAIVIVFVFWGVGNFGEQKVNIAATVNGDIITHTDYNNAFKNLVERYRQNFGSNFNNDMIERFNIKQQALDGLIDQKLLLQEAARLNFKVSEEELIDTITKMDAFKENGAFDKIRYRKLLTNYRMSPEDFETAQKESMTEQKLRAFIFNSVRVSDQEVKEWFEWENRSLSIEYAMFEPEIYKDIQSPSDEDTKAFFEKNKDNYKTEPKVKAQFLYFNPETYKSGLSVSDDEMRDYYDEHPEEFKTPKSVKARHILIKTEKDSKPEVIEEKKQKALNVLKMIKEEGKDFAAIAKEYSEDPGSKDNGGDLGEFTKERMVKPFADKAFSMNPGEVSDPVLSQFGWHIIKVESVNEEKNPSFEESKDKINKKLTDEKAKNLAYEKAEAVYNLCFEGDNLAKIAETQGLQIIVTDPFTRKGPEKDVKNRYKFASTAFGLDVMGFSSIQDLGDGYYIIQVTEKIAEEISPFDDVKEKVWADIMMEKKDEKAKTEAEAFFSGLKEGKESADELCKKHNVTLKGTDFFKRNSPIPDIGNEREIAEAVFKMSAEKKLPEKVFKGRKGYYVIRFKESRLPDAAEFEKEKKAVKDKLLQQKKFKAFTTWLAQIREKSKVEVFVNNNVN